MAGKSPYTQEFKDKAVMLYLEGMNSYQVAEKMGCSHCTVQAWVKDSGFEMRTPGKPRKEGKSEKGGVSKAEETIKSDAPSVKPNLSSDSINPLLLSMADGNDLSAFVGKEICRMSPREIYKFLELLNIKGDLVVVQKVRLK